MILLICLMCLWGVVPSLVALLLEPGSWGFLCCFRILPFSNPSQKQSNIMFLKQVHSKYVWSASSHSKVLVNKRCFMPKLKVEQHVCLLNLQLYHVSCPVLSLKQIVPVFQCPNKPSKAERHWKVLVIMNQVHLFRYKWGSRPTETNWSKSSENSVSGAIFCMHLGIKKKKERKCRPLCF